MLTRGDLRAGRSGRGEGGDAARAGGLGKRSGKAEMAVEGVEQASEGLYDSLGATSDCDRLNSRVQRLLCDETRPGGVP